uniref:non-specific serine/threonine protein kinase n=1 Tax=Rhodosorus marinus TaxID=101924 RepID=A0A7S2ZCT3_9RHOD|mmetsp:Transcript_13281/g.52997  ORF Transcript_13281/g.52997 Transcript_13281/m.52997 type:complete len:382 (+) Transcript_13281:133-1278(+)
MAEDDSRKDPVPPQVGDGRNRYEIIRTAHLGSGHFGDVYMGQHYTSREKVAVKLEHRSGSIARREWEVMSAMDGNGAPRVHYTGMHGRYYVMVMDLLGPTLQRLLESKPNRHLSFDQVMIIGTKCVELLRKLHAKGYVHGDVKPENFLCSPSEGSTISDPSKGLYMIDLGLASKWRDSSRANGHISYGQRVDHFSGTVRYASVNAHLGRWLSRRDDLESLGYMLLYLFNGSLPWQGYCGDDKNMQVCETKGRLTIESMCRGAPEIMQYYIAYVKNLKFEDRPQYDYLLMLFDSVNGGMRKVRTLIEQRSTEATDKDSWEDDSRDKETTATAGQKRKRSNNEESAETEAEPIAKKYKLVVPKRIKTHQWVIISTSARTGNVC